MATQSADLHRSLLRPMIIHTLRGTGFHSTKPSVLDALVNLAERHMLLLAASTAQQAQSAHNDPVPTLTDIRNALTECGTLIPYEDATEEEFRERMRRPIADYETMKGGLARMVAERRRRDAQDSRDINDFAAFFDSHQYAEIKRVAGMAGVAGPGAANVGVGGNLVHAEDVLTSLKRKYAKGGQEVETRFAPTVLGHDDPESAEVTIDGGKTKRLRHWAPNTVASKQRTIISADAQRNANGVTNHQTITT